MRIVPFTVEHLNRLVAQPAQAHLRDWYEADPAMARRYEDSYSFSLLADDGSTLACAGLLEFWPGRGYAWAYLSADIKAKGLLCMVRAIKREFAINTYTRIEACVDREFEQGHRLMELLEFVNETPSGMRKFVNGRTYDLYARIK